MHFEKILEFYFSFLHLTQLVYHCVDSGSDVNDRNLSFSGVADAALVSALKLLQVNFYYTSPWSVCNLNLLSTLI